jgi:hypothetical protein
VSSKHNDTAPVWTVDVGAAWPDGLVWIGYVPRPAWWRRMKAFKLQQRRNVRRARCR